MKAISVEDLKPGMTLARTLVNDDMVVILSEGTLLTKAHITRLSFLNLPLVYIKDEYELNTNFQNVVSMFSPSNAFVTSYKEILGTAKSIFDSTIKDGKIPIKETSDLVDKSLFSMTKESGAVDYLLELNHLASDIYNHSLRVAVLAGVLGKWMHFSRKKTEELIMAGFLHDIGKTKFSKRLLEKQIKFLQGEDLEAYMKHTVDGHHILSEEADFPDSIKLTALQHHECMDGSGFPFNSTGKDIHEFARIIAVVDRYDNITTEREGQKKETPFVAIDSITTDMYTKLDPHVCVPFLANIRQAFLGSRILLSNGLEGTIVRYPNDLTSKPLVRISQEVIVDLNKEGNLTILEYNPK